MDRCAFLCSFLTVILLLFGCVPGTMQGVSQPSPQAQAFSRATQAMAAGDFEGYADIYRQLIPDLEKEHLFLSLAVASSNLASHYLFRVKDLARAMEYAQKTEEAVARVERIGLDKIDDNGAGERLSRLPVSRQHQEMSLASAKNIIASVKMKYYRAAGESEKAKAYERKTRKTYERLQQSMVKAMEKDYEQMKQGPGSRRLSAGDRQTMGQSAHEQREMTKRYAEAQRRLGAMIAEVLYKRYTGDTGSIDPQAFARICLEADPVASSFAINARNYAASGMTTEAEDYRRAGRYFERRFLQPWAAALRADLLHLAGLDAAALVEIKRAMAGLQAVIPEPKLRTRFVRSWWRQMKKTMLPQKTVPPQWQMLRAEILTALDDPGAVSQWERTLAILHNVPPSTGAYGSASSFFLDKYREKAALELSMLYEKEGKAARALSTMEEVLSARESVRATFAVETHKRGYLAGSKPLYERYLRLSLQDPGRCMVAMERAKSRAMVDLMAQTALPLEGPVFQHLARQRAAAMPGKGKGVRAVAVAPKELDEQILELRQRQPELASLVSVETPSERALEALLPAGTLALSYFLSEDAVYINVFGRGKRVLKRLAVPRSEIFAKIYDFRRRIQDPKHESPAGRGGTVTLRRRFAGGKEEVIVDNNMAFPLNIVSITSIIEDFSAVLPAYPMLPTAQEEQWHIQPENTIIPPGTSGVVVRRDHSGGFPTSRTERLIIDTNLGHLSITGLFLIPEGAGPRIVEMEKTLIAYHASEKSLYEILIKPVERELDAKHLLIVPHSALHFLPFEALKDGQGRFLTERFVISYTPSLSALRFCQQKNTGKKDRLVAFGDPLGDLRYARTEVEDIRPLFSQAKVFTGSEVTPPLVAKAIGEADIIHFACHGIFDPASPFNSALILHGSAGQPQPMTVTDIMRLKATPYLVTLSACDTGLARISGGDELLGLVRGFFVAGTPSLVTTLWKIDDRSTAMLICRFYYNLTSRNMTRARALREAKLYLMREGYGRPYFWAPFILLGDWR